MRDSQTGILDDGDGDAAQSKPHKVGHRDSGARGLLVPLVDLVLGNAKVEPSALRLPRHASHRMSEPHTVSSLAERLRHNAAGRTARAGALDTVT